MGFSLLEMRDRFLFIQIIKVNGMREEVEEQNRFYRNPSFGETFGPVVTTMAMTVVVG